MAEYAAQVQRLVDAKAEAKQKQCIAEITTQTSATFRHVPKDEAYARVIDSLRTVDVNYVKNALPQYRRGGMSTIKATLAGLPQNKGHDLSFVKFVTEMVFPSFADVDPAVRIAAVETAHEMVRRLQTDLFQVSFMELFRAMLSVVGDRDKRVVVLGRELSSTVRELVSGSTSELFPPEQFVTFLTDALDSVSKSTSELDPSVVQWLLQWVRHVYDLPGHELVLQLPRFLGHLFHISARSPSDEATKVLERSLDDTRRVYGSGNHQLDLKELMVTTMDCVSIEVPTTRKLTLEWGLALLALGGPIMLPLTHSILDAVLPQLGSKELPIRIAGQNVNLQLQHLVARSELEEVDDGGVTPPSSPVIDEVVSAGGGATEGQRASTPLANDAESPKIAATASSSHNKALYYPVLQTVMSHLDHRAKEETRIAALGWFILVHGVRPNVVREHFDTVFDCVLTRLGDPSESVVHKAIEVLVTISGEDRFSYFIDHLLGAFEARATVLLPRAPTIIKSLQLRYQGDHVNRYGTCEKLFNKIAELLPSRQDKRFVEKMVVVLSMMLLTSRELMPLRDVLKRGIHDSRARDAFLKLYVCWVYDVVAAIALCLLTRTYAQAFRLVVLLGSWELSPQTLVQVDRLVQLFESPIFSFVRIALLHPSQNAALVRTMFGLLMMLPQSSPQFKALNGRLKAVPSVGLLERPLSAGPTSSSDPSAAGTEEACQDDPIAAFLSSEDEARERDSLEEVQRLDSTRVPTVEDWKLLERHCAATQRLVLSYEQLLRSQQR